MKQSREAAALVVAAGLLCMLAPNAAWAQSFTGAIVGTVTDPTGAGIPEARVVAIEENTNVPSETVSDTQGSYALPSLRPGTYRLEASKTGFKKLARAGIAVQINDRLSVDLALSVGDVAETVSVVAAAPLVESESAALGNVIQNRQIVNLPLNTRNPFQLTALSPGVVPSVNFGDAFNSSANFMINGGRGNTSEVLIDGITNSVPAANPIAVISVFPSVDALEEFKVQTNSYAAEYGRSGGGIVNMVIRSGTNRYHGTLFEFLRNSTMDANSFFANRNGVPLASFKRNQFGFTVGGPIKRDQLFFFINYEGLRQRVAANATRTLPTALERQGDFRQSSQRVGAACQPVQIFDPVTTRQGAGGAYVRDPFPEAVVPASRFDPAGVKLLSYFPLPNRAGDACTGINNFFSSKTAKVRVDQMDMKFDWAPGSKNKYTAGLSWRAPITYPANHYGTIAETATGLNGDRIPAKSMRLDYVRTHSPTLLFNLRFGVTRLERRTDPNAPEGFSLADLGISPNVIADASKPFDFPQVTYQGYAGQGASIAFIFQAGTSYTINANATKVRGNHTIKWGIDYRINQSFEYSGFSSSGNFSFARGLTQGPDPNRPQADRGNAIASALLGTGGGEIQILPGVLSSNAYMGLFVQDDIRLTPRLTMNIGLRYDLENGRDERFNKLSWFDFTAPSPLAQMVPGMPDLRGGLRFVGVDGDRQFDTDKNNFGPRIGFAYSPTRRTAVRAAYGIFYLPYSGEAAGTASGINGFSATTQWVGSVDGLRPTDYLSDAFPRGLTLPSAPQSGLLTNVGQIFGSTPRDGAIDRTARVGYMQQWNLSIQRELPGNIAVEAAYTGSKGTKLIDGPYGHEVNQLRPEYMALGTALQQLVRNPFFGIISTGTLSRPEVTRGQLLRPYPQYLGLVNYRPASAASVYHAFQMRFEKRFSRGLTLLAAYTNSKLIDDASQTTDFLGPSPQHQDVYNRRASRSVSGQDVSQRLVLSYVYQLPFGSGKALGGDWPRALDMVIGNWQINGITTFSTSVPLSISTQNNSGAFSAAQRPNVSGNAELPASRPTDQKLAQWLDTSVFSQPAPFTFGNAPRVLPNVRRDGIQNFDFSLFKQFPFGERRQVEFRAEFFNLFNTPQFGAPGTGLLSGGFGVVSGQANIPRQVQLGLKVYF